MDLTARGIRRIGQKALKEVFAHLKKDRIGAHLIDTRGANGDLLGETKPYEFGDPFQIDLQMTVKNALLRGGPEVPVRLTPQDFEIYRTEHMTRSATAVLLDQSRSMGLFNNFQAAKKSNVGSLGPHKKSIPPGYTVRHWVLRLCPRDSRRRPSQGELELLGFRHQFAPCPNAGA
jgi:uncharacterized protein with von Willebrand factor type A (vWA) domain